MSTAESTKDIETAIEKLKSADKVGRAGEVLGVAGGAVAGASAAGVSSHHAQALQDEQQASYRLESQRCKHAWG